MGAAARKRQPVSSLLPIWLLCLVCASSAQPYIGVNYGEVADNLPPPEETARLLKSTAISKVRLYGVDAGLIRALAGSNISVVIGVANGDIPSLAADPAAASRWMAANVLPFVPATAISVVAVGNEVLESGDASLAAALLPAMQNLRAAATAAADGAAGVRFSTVNTMGVMAQSDPPSTGAFHPDIAPQLQGLRVEPGRPPAVRRRHAADAGEAGGDVPVRALRRGPQARADVGALLRAVPHGPEHGVRRRPGVRGGGRGRSAGGGAAAGRRRVVRGAGRRVGRGAAGGPGLRVRAGGRGLRRHPARRRVLRAQHGARPRGVRHEPAVPGGGAAPLELRLPGVRDAHLRQPETIGTPSAVANAKRPLVWLRRAAEVSPWLAAPFELPAYAFVLGEQKIAFVCDSCG
ncbi:glucan endo-1,3-beta-glucosidase 7 [Panicum miliaceum]|uniref:Glucan endo-1,3-beta-glucosidase 7 n=1 Tax=Panicum miliaceum TaxID=4540 RepID=A0A3L6TG01_PANMI|nr:glucan endo-1,3-beta-glucosidase 7 [Panicum miliaceum]